MRKGLWIVLAVLLFLVPRPALANTYVESFSQGLGSWNVEERREEEQVGALDYGFRLTASDSPVFTQIRSWVNSLRLTLFGTTRNMFDASLLSIFLRWRGGFIIVAVGLVFMWWGVRKAIRMLFSAFRKGKINV